MSSPLDRTALCVAMAVAVGAAALLTACNAFDEDRIGDPPGSGGGQGGAGSGGQSGSSGGGGAGADGGSGDGGVCMEQAEACNLRDDDCDGTVDERMDTIAACEKIVLNAETTCVNVEGTARCLKIECLPGFSDGDGDPRNGCEVEDDEGDGGADQDGGS
jgi:hypothetical protein